MKHSIIILNAGSSSLKFKLFIKENLETIGSGQITGIGTEKTKLKIKDHNDETIQEKIIDSATPRDQIVVNLIEEINTLFPEYSLEIAGHRVVHGSKYVEPAIVDDALIDYLKSIISLAPLHIPHNVRPMEILKEKFPSIKQMACFDTAFHATNPMHTRYFALPKDLADKEGLMRYGFHGLSYEYINSQVKELDENLHKGKVVVCHLGAGASLAGIVDGKGYTTTMGFTPLDGLVMGTRTGAIDPGAIIYLLKEKKYTVEQLEKLLWHESGVLGLSGESSDFYTIETSDKEQSKEAWNICVYNLVKHIGSMIAVIGGIDGLVFTAGVGENSSKLRKEVIEGLSFFGIKLDADSNKNKETIISTSDSKVKVMVIPTEEELMIAKHSLTFYK